MQNCDCKVTTILLLLQYVFYRMLTENSCCMLQHRCNPQSKSVSRYRLALLFFFLRNRIELSLIMHVVVVSDKLDLQFLAVLQCAIVGDGDGGAVVVARDAVGAAGKEGGVLKFFTIEFAPAT